ncbi:carbamate kinase [Erythrobacter sp. SN021]|uniref:carbamate kinase n=1 Tax=Erythrobacter sp. SN021 TaxID=2912574 RepID=UPI001F01331D|nr:carbamate kinase [Erythrobacter sp. SN021]MCF8882052.1 carbamate kinase [Erythrobacter sp. SN021]
MRIVVALGGNALLQRGEALTAANQRENIRIAAAALAPLADEHELIISHGNGPQVGLLALQGAAYKPEEAFPLDVLGAQTEGMIGYMIEQELRNRLPPDKPLATMLTMVEVEPDDPAFGNPTKFVGPVYADNEAQHLAREKGWAIKRDGENFRRVVPSPAPRRIAEIAPIRWLLDKSAIVICAGGGGIPVTRSPDGLVVGVEAVIDKDAASALLAHNLDADLLVMATDVDAVYRDWGQTTQRRIQSVTPGTVDAYEFPAGSMGPKVQAAVDFVTRTGKRAAIGALTELGAVIAGQAGTAIIPDERS